MYSKHDLIFVVPEVSVSEKAAGQFAQKVMVLVLHDPSFPQWQPFLEKLLSAARLNLAIDTQLIILNPDEQVSMATAIKSKQPEQVLVFGLLPEQLGLHIAVQKYQPVFFHETTFLFADKLSVLEPDKNLKMNMWTAMKTLFKIA